MMFDKTKYHLGKLCKREHEYENTGTSLRYNSHPHGYIECIRIRDSNRDKTNKNLKYRFGISEIEYQEMFEDQSGLCAICGKPELVKNKLGKTKRLSVDHDHKTGKVRALLCTKCNIKLGKAENFLCESLKYLGVFG